MTSFLRGAPLLRKILDLPLRYIKQLLDDVEHDIVNYQNQGLCYMYLPKPKAEAEHSKGLSNQADVELDMINAISAADIALFMSSSQAIVN